ncbi:hypothetical protein [Parvularcula oceani]|uniref:hypothetical protein n=1 Tax=Parvularcula oceani TaxID=1247963 RepID=UPI00055D67AF|nr:hypothetical protein [Parvularcula oceani]
MNPSKTIIRFAQCAEQSDGPIKRIVGFVEAKHLISLFDDATLDANPRSAKANTVTTDIIDSVRDSPAIFQFKTKGILLGTSDYDELERRRYELRFHNPAYEGLLDGGHNMLALGTFLLGHVMDERQVKKIKLWSDLKAAWDEHGDEVRTMRDEFTFKVPVELLVPSEPEDEEVTEAFKLALIEVCAARNNNAQLTSEAKSNQRGFYEALRDRLPSHIAERVEWKSNEWESDDTRPIKVRDVIALSWIPLGVLAQKGLLPTQTEEGSPLSFEFTAPKLYSGKGEVSKLFDRLMEHPAVSKPQDGPRHELHSTAVGSAFDVTGQLPELFDTVFLGFKDAYNKETGGAFGRIKAVKVPKRGKVSTPYLGLDNDCTVPDGFVLPVVYGLRALMKIEDGLIGWTTEPRPFLDRNLPALIGAFRMPMEMAGFDPQKVAKSENSYRFMEGEVEKALMKEQARRAA